MDSASDLDTAAKGLGVYPEGAATVRGRREGSHRKREGIRKGRSPDFQHDFRPDEPSPPLPSPLPSASTIIPKCSFSASQPTLWISDQSSQAQLQPGSPLSPSNLLLGQPGSRTLKNTRTIRTLHRCCIDWAISRHLRLLFHVRLLFRFFPLPWSSLP